MKTYGGVDVLIHVFLTLAVLEVSGQLHALAALPREERAHCTHWIGGLVGPRAGTDDVKKYKFFTLQEIELRPLDRPARGQ
jgi:hypothetical protein